MESAKTKLRKKSDLQITFFAEELLTLSTCCRIFGLAGRTNLVVNLWVTVTKRNPGVHESTSIRLRGFCLFGIFLKGYGMEETFRNSKFRFKLQAEDEQPPSDFVADGEEGRSSPVFESPWTAAQAAQFLKIHPRTITRMAQLGEIPAFRIGTHWRFLPSSLDSWMRSKVSSVPKLVPVRRS